MIITLDDGSTTLTLPEDLLWTNEHDWHPVVQARAYTVTGAMWLHSQVRAAGRPIVLQADERRAWMTRAEIAALAAWAAMPGLAMVLSLDAVDYDVVFDHEAGAMEARPVADFSDPLSTDYAIATLRFITI
jgi:hypothetical protein